jgi:hypothetical protein
MWREKDQNLGLGHRVFFKNPNLYSAARAAWHRGDHVCVVRTMLRRGHLMSGGQRELVMDSVRAKWVMVRGIQRIPSVNCNDFLRPGSQTARGLARAPVSSRKRSRSWTCVGWVNSWEKFRGRPFVVRCFRRALGHGVDTKWVGPMMQTRKLPVA